MSLNVLYNRKIGQRQLNVQGSIKHTGLKNSQISLLNVQYDLKIGGLSGLTYCTYNRDPRVCFCNPNLLNNSVLNRIQILLLNKQRPHKMLIITQESQCVQFTIFGGSLWSIWLFLFQDDCKAPARCTSGLTTILLTQLPYC